MKTEGTIGKCNQCGSEVAHDHPSIGHFCRQIVTQTFSEKDETETKREKVCFGVICRRERKFTSPAGGAL